MNRLWPDLEIRVLTGCPTLCLDGVPWFGMAVERPFAGDHFEAFERLAGVGVRHFHVDATCAEDIYHPELRFWTGPDTFEPAAQDALLRRLLAIRPDALFTLRVFVGAPDWWMEVNPGHQQIYADGSDRRVMQRSGVHRVPSLASPKWQADINHALERYIRWLMESGWSQRVAGLFLCNGITWEWGLLGSDGLPDYSPHALEYFRGYLRRKYRTDAALTEAWGRDARLDEAAIPDGTERLRGFGENGLRNLPACQAIIDHQQSISAMNVDLLLSLAATAKRVSERRAIIGAFYGYTITAREQNEFTGTFGAGGFVGGHHALDRVLRSADIDFLASPFHYANRKLGTGLLWEHVPLASVHRHGKVFWDENDLWTYTNPPVPHTLPKVMDVGHTPTLRETILTYRRAWAMALVRGKHQWLTELTNWIGNFRENFSDPDFLQEIGRLHAASDELLRRDRSANTQVAYVIDEESIAHLSPDHKGFLAKVYFGTVRWARLGAPFDVILLSDLLAAPASYRLVVPACVKSPAAIDALKTWAKREGAELLWDGTAGWYPPEDSAPLHEAYARAGVHQYLPGEQAYANASMLVTHVDAPGARTVRLPRNGTETCGTEFFSGQPFATQNGEFSWDFDDKDVRLFLFDPHPRP